MIYQHWRYSRRTTAPALTRKHCCAERVQNFFLQFLADPTNGRAYVNSVASVCRLYGMYCG